jgi:hypothetical protein
MTDLERDKLIRQLDADLHVLEKALNIALFAMLFFSGAVLVKLFFLL